MFDPVTRAPKSRNTTPDSRCRPECVRMSAERRSSSMAPRTAVPAGRQRVAVERHQELVVAPPHVDDPRLDATPEQHAVIRWLAAAAGVEGRAVEDDPELGIGVQDGRLPLAQRRVGQLEPMGARRGRHAYFLP